MFVNVVQKTLLLGPSTFNSHMPMSGMLK